MSKDKEYRSGHQQDMITDTLAKLPGGISQFGKILH